MIRVAKNIEHRPTKKQVLAGMLLVLFIALGGMLVLHSFSSAHIEHCVDDLMADHTHPQTDGHDSACILLLAAHTPFDAAPIYTHHTTIDFQQEEPLSIIPLACTAGEHLLYSLRAPPVVA